MLHHVASKCMYFLHLSARTWWNCGFLCVAFPSFGLSQAQGLCQPANQQNTINIGDVGKCGHIDSTELNNNIDGR